MQEVTAYTCDFCPKGKRNMRTKKGCFRHEKNCYYNPARRACASCAHFTKIPHVNDYETGFHEGGPECAEDFFRRDPEDGQLRVDCEKWAPKPVEEG